MVFCVGRRCPHIAVKAKRGSLLAALARNLLCLPQALIVNGGRGFYRIPIENDLADRFFHLDSYGLCLGVLRAGIADSVVFEYEVVCLTSNTNAGGSAGCPVVLNYVIFKPISMGGHSERFVAKEYPVLGVPADNVAPQQVVGILMSDRDAELPVALELVILE